VPKEFSTGMGFWGSGRETCFVLFEGELYMLDSGIAGLEHVAPGASRFMAFGRGLIALLNGRFAAVGVAGPASINPVQTYALG
jgi:hypothetical protein